MRTMYSIAAVLVAAMITLSGLVLAPTANAATPPGPVGSTRVWASAPTGVRLEAVNAFSYEVTGTPHCGAYDTCQVYVGEAGADWTFHWAGGTATYAWPEKWKAGQTRTPQFWTYSCLGFLCKASSKVSGSPVTRPWPTNTITAKVDWKQDPGRRVHLSGTATAGADIRYRGQQIATASVGDPGTWQADVYGLAPGENTLVVEQWVNGQYRDQTTVTVTFPEDTKPGQIIGDSGSARLPRGTTTDVSVSYTAKSAFTTPTGTLSLEAPEGTTFAPGQDQQRGEYRDSSGWHAFGGDSIIGGERSADGSRYDYRLADRNWAVAKDQQFRFTVRVVTPVDVATTSSELTGRLTGSFTGATFDTTARTTTTVVGAPFTAAVHFEDDVTEPVTISGDGVAGATVTIRGAWVAVPPARVSKEGGWTITLPAPDEGGKKTVTAVQTIDQQDAGSEQVEVDYGQAVSITSPVDDFPISPIWDTVRVSGRAEPNARVSLGEGADTAAHGTVTAGADGRWAIRTGPLAMRDHDLVATALSKGANTTTATVRITAGH